MSKKSPQDDEAAIRARRRFLIGAGSVAGLAALTATGISIFSKDEKEPYKIPEQTGSPKGDWNREIDQSEVNRIYREIYNKIKDAKDNNKTGKPLAIVIAEGHHGVQGLIT